MTNWELALCTLGMIASTALPRALPLTLLADKPIPIKAMRWLGYVPAAILAALAAPDIFLNQDAQLYLSFDNVFLLAALPTLLVAVVSKSLFGSLATGMGVVALLRWLLG